MKKFWSLLFAGAMMIVLGAACEKGSDAPKPPLFDTIDVPFTEYSLKGTAHNEQDAIFSDTDELAVLLINSQDELNKYLDGESYPAIDFSKKTLVVAYATTGSITSITPTFQQISAQDYLMTVDLEFSEIGSVDWWWISIVVDKLDVDAKVKSKLTVAGKPFSPRSTYE